jgi:hypothetical protein
MSPARPPWVTKGPVLSPGGSHRSAQHGGISMSPRRAERGATLVEFVIISPLAFLFVLGLIQVGFLMMAKLQLNHAAFMAARHGATNNALKPKIEEAVVKGLIPFYQDSTITNDTLRIATAWATVQGELLKKPWLLDVQRLSPSAKAFTDFGIKHPTSGKTYIPNDSLSWRSTQVRSAGVSIQDANLLKIKVTYAYEMKVPLIAGVVKRMMCGGASGVEAFGNVPIWAALGSPADCLKYYLQGRLPIVAYALVEMHSPAYQN